MQCSLNYSGTRFFPIENKNYSISQWILSYVFHITLYLCSEHSFVFFLNQLTVNERASISRAILEIKGNVVMYIHKYIHSYIQKSQMKLALGTGNPAWSCTRPELVPGFAALLNEAEYHLKNYGDREMCYQPRPITPLRSPTLALIPSMVSFPQPVNRPFSEQRACSQATFSLYPHTFNMHICFNYSC